MRAAVPAACLAALLAALVGLRLTLGEQGRVVGSAHDLGVAADPGVSTCEVCHLPHDASGDSLWAGSPFPEGDPFSGSAPLCYSCHDGTVTAGGEYVFDPETLQHPVTPGEAGEDCDTCHDVHVADYGSFLLFPSGANHCRACHGGGADSHPLNVDAIITGYAPEDGGWDPDQGDVSGTRLWDADGWRAGSQVKCLTCHSAHGAVPETGLLTMRSEDSGSEASLCANCHR